MASLNDLRTELEALAPEARENWISSRLVETLQEIGRLRRGRHVLLYSAAVQDPATAGVECHITQEDIGGFISVMYDMDWTRGLTLLLYSPGGTASAAEAIVSYLRGKFADFEVIVPGTLAGAGTMIALAADRIVMHRDSKLGPVDPDAETLVAGWLQTNMFQGLPTAPDTAASAARQFTRGNADAAGVDRTQGRACGLMVHDLESDPALDDAVLSAFQLTTLALNHSPFTRTMHSDTGRTWSTQAGQPRD